MSGIMAGIVLYNAELERLFQEISSVSSQVNLICLCDNGSSNIGLIEEKLAGNKNIVFIKNKDNLGIGAASNQICEYAEQHEFEWVLMLDHDTVCPLDLVSTYVKHMDDGSVGMMCPNVVDKEIVNNKYSSSCETETEYIARCIQSSTFIKVSAWRQCHGFNEWMFIDFVDFDFCKRMELSGFKILRCNTVTVDHQLGKRTPSKHAALYEKLYKKTKFRLFRYLTYNNEFSAARVFYCTRNNIAYIKSFSDHINKRKEWADFFKRIIKRIVRSNHKAMIIKETFRGILAGVKYKPEKYNAY